jgi:hypothetical protein
VDAADRVAVGCPGVTKQATAAALATHWQAMSALRKEARGKGLSGSQLLLPFCEDHVAWQARRGELLCTVVIPYTVH